MMTETFWVCTSRFPRIRWSLVGQSQPVYEWQVHIIRFHDWVRRETSGKLKIMTVSMKRVYSQLTLEDFILPVTGTTPLSTVCNMQIYAFLSAPEGTKKHRCVFLDRTDLLVHSFHLAPDDGTGVVTQLD